MAATPKPFTDGTTDLDEDNLNRLLNAVDLQVKINWAVLSFTATATSADVATGFSTVSEIVSGDVSYDSTNNEIDVTLSGYSTSPVAVASIMSNSSSNVAEVYPNVTSSTGIELEFQDATAGGGTASPDGDMTVGLIVVGD